MSILTAIQCDRCGVVAREPKADGLTWLRLSSSGFMAGAFIATGAHDFCSERCLMMWLTTKDSESKMKLVLTPVGVETKIVQLQARVLALEQSLKIIEDRLFSSKPNPASNCGDPGSAIKHEPGPFQFL